MGKKISLIVFFIVAAFTVPAQSQNGLGTNDVEAKKILDAVSIKFKSFKTVQSKFFLKIENASNKVMGNIAGMVYMKGVRYRISASNQEIFCDGTNVWTLDKAAKEVNITKLDPNNNTITPQKLFTSFYDKDFLYKLNGEKNGLQEIELTPTDKNKPFFKVLVSVIKTVKMISSIKVFEKAGNRNTYSVSGMNTSNDIPDATFVFDIKKYPGVNVEDLR